jgi:hypothetical protein
MDDDEFEPAIAMGRELAQRTFAPFDDRSGGWHGEELSRLLGMCNIFRWMRQKAAAGAVL